MAITKIHAIQATVNKAVDYICNPAKTDENILISSFGCSPETAAFDFKFALSKTNQADPNKAFHLIQAFMPGEVSYKEAHQIGIELADKLLEGKYSYIELPTLTKDTFITTSFSVLQITSIMRNTMTVKRPTITSDI